MLEVSMPRTILIVGAGPAGLSLARALAGSAHRVVLIEPQDRAALTAPPPDGREIALTLRSQKILSRLGAWDHIPARERFPLREARVRNGGSPFALSIGSGQGAALGHLVSNHLVRAALFKAVDGQPNVTLLSGRKVVEARSSAAGAEVTLDDGTCLSADLLIAADTRFSKTREQLGIAAAVERFGHTMLVGRIAHGTPHQGVATEWFDHGRTVALLPLGEGQSSLVLTLPDAEGKRVCALDDAALTGLYEQYLCGEWGRVSLVTRPTPYPLAMTYAERFTGPRCALVGDAAVGMHPVTAHGFNFGLLSAWRLARVIGEASDPGDPSRLRRYAIRHRVATMPLYHATLHLVGLFTDERALARPLRAGVLRLGALPPVRRIMGKLLSEPGMA